MGLVACGWLPNRIARSAVAADAVFAGSHLLFASLWRGIFFAFSLLFFAFLFPFFPLCPRMNGDAWTRRQAFFVHLLPFSGVTRDQDPSTLYTRPDPRLDNTLL